MLKKVDAMRFSRMASSVTYLVGAGVHNGFRENKINVFGSRYIYSNFQSAHSTSFAFIGTMQP